MTCDKLRNILEEHYKKENDFKMISMLIPNNKNIVSYHVIFTFQPNLFSTWMDMDDKYNIINLKDTRRFEIFDDELNGRILNILKLEIL